MIHGFLKKERETINPAGSYSPNIYIHISWIHFTMNPAICAPEWSLTQGVSLAPTETLTWTVTQSLPSPSKSIITETQDLGFFFSQLALPTLLSSFIRCGSYGAGMSHTHSLQGTICQNIMTFYMCEYFKVYEKRHFSLTYDFYLFIFKY